MVSSDPQGRVALMLCESALHVLVEEGVLSKAKAIEVIETVAELTREIAESDLSDTTQIAVDLVEGIAASFALQASRALKGFSCSHPSEGTNSYIRLTSVNASSHPVWGRAARPSPVRDRYFIRSWILAIAARAHSSSKLPPGAPLTPIPAIVFPPAMIA